MMRLLSSPPSPFGRKVKLTARIKGVMDRITVETVNPTVPGDPTLAAANPLGKIPALVLGDGTALYDSRVICEYLDTQSPSPMLFPPFGIDRFRMLTRAARADGILEAALLIVYEERFRPEDKRSPDWVARQQGKIDAALAAFETSVAEVSGPMDYAQVTLAAALGYLDFRHGGRWRPQYPALVQWLDAFAARVPAFAETTPTG
jgi:glutathione S-transferase